MDQVRQILEQDGFPEGTDVTPLVLRACLVPRFRLEKYFEAGFPEF